MTTRTLGLRDVKKQKIEDVFREVVSRQQVLTVRLPEGDAVRIQPSPRLEPLPKLRYVVPKDWRDAINGPGD
jgi:hypothetical protein